MIVRIRVASELSGIVYTNGLRCSWPGCGWNLDTSCWDNEETERQAKAHEKSHGPFEYRRPTIRELLEARR